jgi:hypothetical protein
MIKTKALSSAAVLGMVAMLFAGCGDGDNTKTQVCRPAEASCLEDGRAQVCSADGTEFEEFSCEDGETCSNGACVEECTPGEFTCAGKSVSRVCTDAGDQWEPIPCPVGTACVEGDGCVPSDEGVTICTPDETVCANGTTVKTCDSDGAGWVYTACPAGVACSDGECSFEEGTSCTPRAKACADNVTAATCKDDGTGWTITDCPEGISCTDGVCQGSGCVVGETKCDEPDFLSILASAQSGQNGGAPAVNFRTLFTCVDGVNWEATQCGAGTICTYDSVNPAEVKRFTDELTEWYVTFYGVFGGGAASASFPALPDTSDSNASCKAPECDIPADQLVVLAQLNYFGYDFYGSSITDLEFAQCGDAKDPSADPTASFSLCEGLPPYRNLEWAVTECEAPATCTVNPSIFIGGAPLGCASECVPGEVRCAFDASGIDSTQECQEDGTWGPAEDCGLIEYEGEETYSGVCVPGHAGGPTVGTTNARCVDPVCAQWDAMTSPFYGLPAEVVGACTQDGLFRACNEDGFLEDPEECDSGTCADWYGGTLPQAGGQFVGFCQTECVDGEKQCFNGNAIQTCVDGEWSLELEICDADVSCYGYDTGNGYYGAICGECAPNTTLCNEGGTGIITCNEDGEIEEDECTYGSCVTNGEFAHCEAPCLEGAKICTGNVDGSTTYSECVNGVLVAQNCGEGTSCRISDNGTHYACVECLGPETSGNSFHLADAYCNAAGDVVACGDDNEYGNAANCDGTCTSYFTASDTAPLSSTYAYCGPAAPAPALQ